MTNPNSTRLRRTLSHTEVVSALTCQAKHDFQYVGQLAGSTLKPRRTALILSDGRAWGAGVAAFHAAQAAQGGLFESWDEGLIRWAAHEALLGSYDESEREQAERGFVVDPDRSVAARTRLGVILDHYMATAERFGNLTMLEGAFSVAIPSRTGKRGSSRYRLFGYIDGFTVDGSGHEWIVEFKLRNQLSDVETIQLSRQIRWYAWARQQLTGQRVVGVIVEERLNEAPKPARIVQAGKESPLSYRCPKCGVTDGESCVGARGVLKTAHPERAKLARQLYGPSHTKDQMTTPELYLEACAEHGVEPEAETVEALRARAWQRRTPIIFRPGELEEAGRELTSAAMLIRDLDSGDRYPIRNAGHLCRSCSFKTICSDPTDIFTVDGGFERTTPKRLLDSPAAVESSSSRAGGSGPTVRGGIDKAAADTSSLSSEPGPAVGLSSGVRAGSHSAATGEPVGSLSTKEDN